MRRIFQNSHESGHHCPPQSRKAGAVPVFIHSMFLICSYGGDSMSRPVRGAIMVKSVCGVALVALLLAPLPATAQNGAGAHPGAPGRFDFYVLALSWSPSFCAEAAERHSGPSPSLQCGPRPFSFVVHGLWPQYDNGFPENCERPAPRLDRRIVAAMLDLMPARRLIYNEWDKHGTCAGLSPPAYFDTVRRARAGVKIPSDYSALKAPLTVAPHAVADAFIKANPGLSANAVAVECNDKRLTEVRLCLAKDFSAVSGAARFHDCPAVVKRGCRRDQVVMPPVRGG
jgi:ribonuclease T2